MFDPVSDRVCLQKLRRINERAEIRRIEIGPLQIVHDLPIRAVVALMLLHDVGEDIHILRIVCEGLDGLHAWEGLESEFRRITEVILTVIGERFIPMPYIPVMHISPVWAVRLVKRPSRRRACRPVEGLGIVLFQHLRDQLLIHDHIIPHFCLLRYPFSLIYEHLHLIIAAPQSQ